MANSMSGTRASWSGDKLPSGMRTGQMANFDPQQMGLYRKGFEQVSPDSYLSKLAGGDQSAYAEMEAPAMRQFSGLQGDIASRFSGMGSGARRSSGFQNSMGAAASNFAQELASQRQQLRRQAMMDLSSMSQQLLQQRPYERFAYEKQKKQSPWGGLAGAAVGGIAGLAVGNPALGASLGYGIGNSMSGGGNSGGGMNLPSWNQKGYESSMVGNPLWGGI